MLERKKLELLNNTKNLKLSKSKLTVIEKK